MIILLNVSTLFFFVFFLYYKYIEIDADQKFYNNVDFKSIAKAESNNKLLFVICFSLKMLLLIILILKINVAEKFFEFLENIFRALFFCGIFHFFITFLFTTL